jgi:hypothetical protein
MRSRRWCNLGLLVTGVPCLVTGFLIQFAYHMHHGLAGRATRMVWGLGYPTWAFLHQLSSAFFVGLVVWHLILNRKPLMAWFKRREGAFLASLFTLATVTALAAWTAGKLCDSEPVEHALVEIHDKLAIPMSVLAILHVWRRRARLLS